MKTELVAKLLMLTTSDNDAEALLAMRKVNQILKEEGVTWASVVSAKNELVTLTWEIRYETLRLEYNGLVKRYNAKLQEVVEMTAAAAYYKKRRWSLFG